MKKLLTYNVWVKGLTGSFLCDEKFNQVKRSLHEKGYKINYNTGNSVSFERKCYKEHSSYAKKGVFRKAYTAFILITKVSTDSFVVTRVVELEKHLKGSLIKFSSDCSNRIRGNKLEKSIEDFEFIQDCVDTIYSEVEEIEDAQCNV